jgi:hypothetical protein
MAFESRPTLTPIVLGIFAYFSATDADGSWSVMQRATTDLIEVRLSNLRSSIAPEAGLVVPQFKLDRHILV